LNAERRRITDTHDRRPAQAPTLRSRGSLAHGFITNLPGLLGSNISSNELLIRNLLTSRLAPYTLHHRKRRKMRRCSGEAA
jgi:hypothetical protein